MKDSSTSQALPRLLALTLVACGGRYVSEGQGAGQGGAQQDPGSTGVGGSSSSRGGQSTGKGGAPASAGMSTGIGGKSVGFGGSVVTAGTATTSGGSIGIGGSVAIGGAVFIGGSAGTGGSNPGMAASDYELCGLYCSRLGQYCPKQPPIACAAVCLADLTTTGNSDCGARKREQLDCITSEITAAQACAFASTGKFCGAPDALPIACAPGECDASIFGDASGCHADVNCAGREADLRCTDTGDAPLCSCWIDGKKAADFAIGVNSAKAACIDDWASVLCVQQL